MLSPKSIQTTHMSHKIYLPNDDSWTHFKEAPALGLNLLADLLAPESAHRCIVRVNSKIGVFADCDDWVPNNTTEYWTEYPTEIQLVNIGLNASRFDTTRKPFGLAEMAFNHRVI